VRNGDTRTYPTSEGRLGFGSEEKKKKLGLEREKNEDREDGPNGKMRLGNTFC